MNPPLQTMPPFPYAMSFVVKLHREADPEQGRLHGRIEHLASGERCEFGDAGELHRRFAELLRQAAPR